MRAIQYELSDLSVLGKMHEFVIDQRNELFLLLHTSAWMKNKSSPKKYQDVSYWYDRLHESGAKITVLEGVDDYQLSHQKLIMRRFLIPDRKKQRRAELIYGSANITNNSKKNIESAFFFPRLSKLLERQLVLDFDKIVSLPSTKPWPVWKSLYPPPS